MGVLAPLVLGAECATRGAADIGDELRMDSSEGENQRIPRTFAGDYAFAIAPESEGLIEGNLGNLLGNNDAAAVFEVPARMVVSFNVPGGGYNCLYVKGKMTPRDTAFYLAVAPAKYKVVYAKNVPEMAFNSSLDFRYEFGDFLSKGNYTPGYSGKGVEGTQEGEFGMKFGRAVTGEMLYFGISPGGLHNSGDGMRISIQSLRVGKI